AQLVLVHRREERTASDKRMATARDRAAGSHARQLTRKRDRPRRLAPNAGSNNAGLLILASRKATALSPLEPLKDFGTHVPNSGSGLPDRRIGITRLPSTHATQR